MGKTARLTKRYGELAMTLKSPCHLNLRAGDGMWGVLFEGERNERFCSTGLVRPCRPSSSAARMSQRLKSAAVVAERDLPAVVRARGGFAGSRLGHRASTRQSLGQAAAHAYRSRRQEPIAGRCDASAMGGAFSFGTARARAEGSDSSRAHWGAGAMTLECTS